MIDLTDCIVLGTITKTHGIHGEVILQLDQLSVDDIKKLESVFIEIDGLPVPFFISSIEEKNSKTLILTFDDVTINNLLDDIINCRVYIKNIDVASGKIKAGIDKNIVGYSVTDKALGQIGKIADILDFEFNPLLKIFHLGNEVLLPFQPEFILKIDHNKKNIEVNVPKGLIELSE